MANSSLGKTYTLSLSYRYPQSLTWIPIASASEVLRLLCLRGLQTPWSASWEDGLGIVTSVIFASLIQTSLSLFLTWLRYPALRLLGTATNGSLGLGTIFLYLFCLIFITSKCLYTYLFSITYVVMWLCLSFVLHLCILTHHKGNNFIINNYRSVWPIDHDDGTCSGYLQFLSLWSVSYTHLTLPTILLV